MSGAEKNSMDPACGLAGLLLVASRQARARKLPLTPLEAGAPAWGQLGT